MSGFENERRRRLMSGLNAQGDDEDGYDVMEVCLNGHQITSSAVSQPQFRKPFCSDCGAKTITTCQECETPIQGHYRNSGVFSSRGTAVPNNCHHCGIAYPWRREILAAAIEAVQLELEGQDAAEAADLIRAVSIDSPRTEISALKLRKLLSKLSKPVYDVAIKVIADISAATAKSHLGI